MTNRKFAKENKAFTTACKRIKLKPTKRQASKYRSSRGAAFKRIEVPTSQQYEESYD